MLEAAPGAGKTTQVPLALLDSGWLGDKRIIMLAPRRMAARAAAQRAKARKKAQSKAPPPEPAKPAKKSRRERRAERLPKSSGDGGQVD